MTPTSSEGIVDRMANLDRARRNMLLAFDLHEAGVEMMRRSLERRHPDAAPNEIARLLAEWLQGREEHGPARGFRVRPFPPSEVSR